MQTNPLNLKKGNYVRHNTGITGVVTKVAGTYIFVHANGADHKFPYFPVNFVRLTKKEYDQSAC